MTKMNQPMQLLTSSESEEWYTPHEIIEGVRWFLGGIELDPASCWAANQWIKADRYYTEADDGLSKEWKANTLFLNPPYGKSGAKSNQDIWARKLESEYYKGNVKEAILLSKCVPAYIWWERLFRLWPVCFIEERVEFLRLSGQGEIISKGRAKAGTNLWYLGRSVYGFIEAFSCFGRVITPNLYQEMKRGMQ